LISLNSNTEIKPRGTRIFFAREGRGAFLGGEGQVKGLLQMPVFSCRSEQQLGELASTQFVRVSIVSLRFAAMARSVVEHAVSIRYATRML
jgi:hypothetical protein